MIVNEVLKKLEGHIPKQIILELPFIIEKYEINTVLKLSHFLAQCSHESSNFTLKTENLNYSAQRLMVIFPKYFKDLSKANEFQKKPEKIANFVYANRMGNGPENSGMGWRFRGRGYLQLTGYDNYKLFGSSINVDVTKNPELVATKYPLTSAAWFFYVKKINSISEKGFSDAVITAVTKKVNGGTIELERRIEKFKKFYALLS